MKKKTYYHIILDQSGSMYDCINQTISGYNEQLQVIQSLRLRYPEQEVTIGLTRFNHDVMHTYYSTDPGKVVPLNREIYSPDGTTALYDAIGTTILKLKKQILDMDVSETSVIVVIITDGHENSSRLFELKAVRSMIKELKQTGKWTFSYLGATIDAIEIAESLNIGSQNSMVFDKTSMSSSYSCLSESLSDFVISKSLGKKSSDFLKKNK